MMQTAAATLTLLKAAPALLLLQRQVQRLRQQLVLLIL